jgi:carotenoid cleavage dioxygenase-like enzyme
MNTAFDNRAPVALELNLAGLKVTGAIPLGLRGTLFRNGPNPCLPDPSAHWFIGDGMVHAFRIGDGGVCYRNRWVRTQAWADANGDAVQGGPGGVANTNVLAHAGKLLALEEAHMPVAMDAASLATRGTETFSGTLPGGPFTAHPKRDPATGALVFFGYDAAGQFTDQIRIGQIGADGAVSTVQTGTAPYAAMVHDFAVTDHFVAIPLFPLIEYTWQPERGAWLGVMDRRAGIASLRWFKAGPGFAFHTMNAWEEDGALVIDLMLSAAPPFFPGADGVMLTASDATLCRWRLDLSDPDAAVTSVRLSDTSGEFPRIDERFAGRRTRHGYFTAFDALVHRDDVTGEEHSFRLMDGDSVSEPVFVPRGAAEGDGWLLAVLFRAVSCTSDLAIFDATDIEAGPVALVHLPCRVPDGFHGNWVGDAT